MTTIQHPIDNIKWIKATELKANDYNPNVVFNQELKLLELSLKKNGWIQPILITQDNEIIDGFHRYSLCKMSKDVSDLHNGEVPCAILNLTEPERMLLTIRINRAKGSHVAVKMSHIIKTLIKEYGLDPKYVAENIGATKEEIDLLMMDDVFKKLDIQNYKYSKAWGPKK